MKKTTEEKQYCVAAEDRATGKRIAITGPSPRKEAFGKKYEMNANREMKKAYRYFHVSIYPYKPPSYHNKYV